MAKHNLSPDTVPAEPAAHTECGCNRPLTAEEERWRQGRKSMVVPMRGKASARVRYVEGTLPLKNGCWLSE